MDTKMEASNSAFVVRGYRADVLKRKGHGRNVCCAPTSSEPAGVTPSRRTQVVTMVISRGAPRKSPTAGEDGSAGRRPGKRLVSEQKQQVRSWFAMARAADREGNVQLAEDLLRKCIDLDDKDGHSWLALARILSRRDPASARKTFLAALTKCPDNVHLLQALGVLEHRSGNLVAARDVFRKALLLEPQNPYVCQAWGLLEQRNGDTEAARRIYETCVEHKPQSEVCAAWATLEMGAGNAEKARELFRMGLKCVRGGLKNKVAYLSSWAEAEERIGGVKQARRLLIEAWEELPNPETRMMLAKLEARAGSVVKALELMNSIDRKNEMLSAAVYNGWAFLEMQANNFEEARELLGEGAKAYSMDGALLQTWGTLEEKCGVYESARELYSRSVEVRPTAVALVAWACMEARLGDVGRARELFSSALRVDPLHGAAYNAYASLEMKHGNISKAREIYERGVDFDPSASVLVGFAQLEMKYGSKIEKARELFRRGVSQTRGDTSFIWHAWLTMELRAKDALVAREIASQARRRYPRNSRILVASALAEASSSRGVSSDMERSRKFFREAVVVDPLHAHAWQAWGVHEFRAGNGSVARELFQKGLDHCPTHGPLWQAWGVLEVEDGNIEKAEDLFRKGIEVCPSHVPLYQAWACMEVRRGCYDVARTLLEQAVRSDPSHGPVWTAYGLLESKYGSDEKSRELFLQGLRHAPNHGPLHRTYALVEERMGNYERARQLFRDGISRDPFDAPSYHALALLEKKMGRNDSFKELALRARDTFGAANVKVVLLEGKCESSANHTEEEDAQLAMLWNMEHVLDLSSRN